MTETDINNNVISKANHRYLRLFTRSLGYVPNLFATMMHSANALSCYYPFHRRNTVFSRRVTEAVILGVSYKNRSRYCTEYHTMIAKLNGLEQVHIEAIVSGRLPLDQDLQVIFELVTAMTDTRGVVQQAIVDRFYKRGFTREHLMDLILIVGDALMTNMISNVFNIPVDAPLYETQIN